MSNDVIRVGLVGYGLAGSTFHAPLIQACERMQLVAILTSRNLPNAVRSFDELLDQSDLVVVASPNSTHFDYAYQALNAHKHVIVDKPFTVTIEEAGELIHRASDRGLVLSVFHNRRWDCDFLAVREILPQLGEIMLFEGNWDRFRPEIKQGWREAPAPGGGLWNDLGPHMVDQAIQLFGIPQAIDADIIAQRSEAIVDDYFDVTLHYGPARVSLRSSTLVAVPRPRFALHGTQGSFLTWGLDPQEAQLKIGIGPGEPQFGKSGIESQWRDRNGTTTAAPLPRGNYPAYYEQVAAAILDGAPVPVTGEEARDGLGLIHLARRASNEGRRLPVPVSNSMEE